MSNPTYVQEYNAIVAVLSQYNEGGAPAEGRRQVDDRQQDLPHPSEHLSASGEVCFTSP